MNKLPDQQNPTAILLDRVCFRYEQLEALHEISLCIEQGAFAVIVGPNGGGKTTLLKLILGLLKPRFGEVQVFGQKPADVRRQIGYVPQALVCDSAFPANVRDVVLMGRVERHWFGSYNAHDRAVALACLWQVGLGEYGQRPFSSLSGGERQRVLIAQALAGEPELLLLDEPNANLDPVGAQRIDELLQELNKRLTIVMVSHNLNIVESYASHLICVNHTAEMHCLADINSTEEGFWRHVQHNGNCPVNSNRDLGSCNHRYNHSADRPTRQEGKKNA